MVEKCPYKAYFDRTPGTVEGVFTIVDTRTGKKVFERLPARSGQEGHTTTDWTRAKSPVPRLKNLRIKIAKPNQMGQWPNGAEIGEFWPIYNVANNYRLITDGKHERWDVGLHPENKFRGSAGCIVLLWDTPARMSELKRLHGFLMDLIGKYSYMPLEIC